METTLIIPAHGIAPVQNIVPANKICELSVREQIRIWRALARYAGAKRPDGLTVPEWAAKQVVR